MLLFFGVEIVRLGVTNRNGEIKNGGKRLKEGRACL